HAGMFRRPTGEEPNLIGHWNFDEGSARDSSPAARHGRLRGNALVATAPGPRPGAVNLSSLIAGMVRRAESSSPVARAPVLLTSESRVLHVTRTEADGSFQLVTRDTNELV